MAAYGWGTEHPIAGWLFAEGHRFDFYQAVRLLEQLQAEAVPVGVTATPGREAVRFKSKVGMDFPPSAVVGIEEREAQPHMTVAFLGLAGCLGPLPAAYSELILDCVRRQDTALRDFLDIFNHRLIAFMYQARKKHWPALDAEAPAQSLITSILYSLFGLGLPMTRHRLRIPDRSLLFYTGLLAQRPRSLVVLERLLADYFRLPRVTTRPLCGGWVRLDPEQRTALGGHLGRNHSLGVNTVLEARVWEQAHRIELVLGPLSYDRFCEFLPDGQAFEPLCELARFYLGHETDVDLRLVLRTAEVPSTRLSARQGPRLGWTTWLKTGSGNPPADGQVRVQAVRWE